MECLSVSRFVLQRIGESCDQLLTIRVQNTAEDIVWEKNMREEPENFHFFDTSHVFFYESSQKRSFGIEVVEELTKPGAVTLRGPYETFSD